MDAAVLVKLTGAACLPFYCLLTHFGGDHAQVETQRSDACVLGMANWTMALIMLCSHRKISSILLAISILASFMGHSHDGCYVGCWAAKAVLCHQIQFA